jgi:hypothetical protein
MSSIIKVDQIQLADGSTPTAGDLGINQSGTIVAAYTVNSSTSAQSSAVSSATDITGMSITMTPKFSNSTIVITTMIAAETHSSHPDKGIRFWIKRDGSNVYESQYDLYNSSDANQRIGKVHLMFNESAVSTSERTYKIAFASTRDTSTAIARVNNYGEPSSMMILEIAG